MEEDLKKNTELVPCIHAPLSPEKSLRKGLESLLISHPCLPAPARPNTNLRFSLVDTSKPKLSDSPSTLNALAWFTFMSRYPSPLGLYLYNILIYGALVGYEGPQTLIISKNLSSALLDPTTINTKLRDDLVLGRVEKVTGDRPFICSPLGLVPKPGGWRRIHHLSYPRHQSVNHHIPDKCAELKYTKFEEVLDMIREGGRSSVILKRDVKDAFRNIPLAPHIRWLFGFSWENIFYVEKCLSFGLCTAPYLFNLFAEALHWMMVSYLHWSLVCHYLDDFIYVIPASEVSSVRLHLDIQAYDELMVLLGMPNNGSKEEQGTVVIVFGIEIDTENFIARLPSEKLEKVRKATSAALASASISLLDIRSLIGYLSFCAKAVRLGRVFMRKLWDFLKAYPSHLSRTAKRRIPTEIREDLQWWNRLLPDFNGVLFFDETHREKTQLFTDASLSGLGGFYYNTPDIFWTSAHIPKPRPLLLRLSILANRRSIRVPTGKALMCLKWKLFSLPLNFGQNFGYAIGSSFILTVQPLSPVS